MVAFSGAVRVGAGKGFLEVFSLFRNERKPGNVFLVDVVCSLGLPIASSAATKLSIASLADGFSLGAAGCAGVEVGILGGANELNTATKSAIFAGFNGGAEEVGGPGGGGGGGAVVDGGVAIELNTATKSVIFADGV